MEQKLNTITKRKPASNLKASTSLNLTLRERIYNQNNVHNWWTITLPVDTVHTQGSSEFLYPAMTYIQALDLKKTKKITPFLITDSKCCKAFCYFYGVNVNSFQTTPPNNLL